MGIVQEIGIWRSGIRILTFQVLSERHNPSGLWWYLYMVREHSASGILFKLSRSLYLKCQGVLYGSSTTTVLVMLFCNTHFIDCLHNMMSRNEWHSHWFCTCSVCVHWNVYLINMSYFKVLLNCSILIIPFRDYGFSYPMTD